MKTGASGPPDVAARISANAAEAPGPKPPPLRRVLAAAALAVVVALLALAARHAILGLLLTRGLGLLTGDRITLGAFELGATHAVFNDVQVTTSGGDPLVDVKRLSVRYDLREMVAWGWGRTHRFGISALTADGPVFSLVRHADGTYNVGSSTPGRGGGPGAAGALPDVDVRVRDGEIRLLDRAPVAPDLGEQRIVGITLDAHLRPNRRSTAVGQARWLSRQTDVAALRSWPLALRATIDDARGIAIGRIDAAQLPLRGGIGFLQHSAAVRVDDGLLRQVQITVYALGMGADRSPDLQVGGAAELSGGRLRIAALTRPVRDVRGRLTLCDDGVWAARLDADLAGIPLIARGGAFNRLRPTLRLGLRADGDLHDLRQIFAFARNQPVSGRAHIETLLEAPVSRLLIRSALSVGRGAYAKAPLSDVSGRVDYHAGSVVLDGVRGRYGATVLGVGARFLLGGPALDSAIAVTAEAPGRAIPFGENLAPEATVDAVALISGGPAGYRARGTLGIDGSVTGAGTFAVDERGLDEFGPFTLARRDGSSVSGALRLERPTSQSAAWISARSYRVAVPARAARFAGLNVPAFPPVAGVIDGDLAGAGPPSAFALAGQLRGRDLSVGSIRLGSGRASLGGTLADVRLDGLAIDGPLGRFAGSGAAAGGVLALRGSYAGSFERLVPLTGNQQARGALSGNVLATVDSSGSVVQSPGARLDGGSLRGVLLDSAAGTIAVRKSVFHLIAGAASIGGRHAVAAESAGTVAVSAPDIPSAALRGTGLPLDDGNVSAYGVADLRGRSPSFAGTVAVAGGRTHGYHVAGDAQIDLQGSRARIFAATGALGSTFGSIGGQIGGIGERLLHYDLDARVPLGDIDLLRRDLGLRVRYLAGTFAAKLHVHGSGTRPFVDGRVEAPEGTYNGLAFRAAGARIVLDPYGIAARDGTLTVGTTQASIDASLGGGGAFGLAAHSPATDLADFNDYFDASDTLAGRGAFDFSVRTYGGRITSRGELDMRGVQYRTFALGRTTAHWRMAGASIAGSATVRSTAGALDATASITPAAGEAPLQAFRAARYDARASLAHFDLGTWLPAIGSNAPVLGRVDARIGVAGRLPELALNIDASLANATVGGFAVSGAHLHAGSRGSRIDVAQSDADLGFAKLSGNGRLGLAPHDPLAFDLRVTSDDVGRAARVAVPAARGLDAAGELDADVRLGGTRAAPKVEAGFDLRNARYGNFTVPRAIGELALSGTAVELRDADVEFTRGQAFVAGSLPLVLQPFGLGPARAPVSFDVTARSVDLAEFGPLLPAGTNLAGIVDGRFGVEGTVDRPRLFGSLDVTGGSYISAFERAPIDRVEASVAFSGSTIALQAFHADVGGGSLDGSGRINLPLGSQAHARYLLGLTAKAAKFDFPAYGRGTVDGKLELTGGGVEPQVSGAVTLRDAVIPVSAVYGTGAATGAAGLHELALNPSFRVQATAADNVRVRSSIVDIGVAGAIDLTGTLRAPRLAGGLRATDGTISSYNHVFRIVNAAVSFNPADGAIPTIEARAISRVSNPDRDPSRNIAGSANIIVTVSGTADSNNLQVTYSSDPAYSQEQIIGLLLDVPALLGAVNFNLNGPGATLLRGAPGETNALLPPGVTPEQESAISFNEEVFSLLNGQFTQRALTPVERVFEKALGLSDIEFTVDYGGGIGYSLRRQLGKRNFFAFLSQTVTYPERSNIGFELEPRALQSINFSYYQQNGVTSLITTQTPGEELFSSTRGLTSVQPLGNRSGFSLNFSRRF